MIFFHHTNEEPERCPACNNIENIKRICAHCGHEYHDKPLGLGWYLFSGLVVVLLLAVVIWCGITLIEWMAQTGHYKRTLVEILQSQWQWLRELRVW